MCPAGTYAPKEVNSKCLPCPRGYTSVEGSDVCFVEAHIEPGTGVYGVKRCCKHD